jgi:thiamine-monophosphate kinase
MNEFDLIAQYFLPLTQGRPEAMNLRDDAALLSVPQGMQMVISTDTMNQGTHFTTDAAPANIAHKSLRAALSDLAAMGAEPLCYQLAIAFPQKPDPAWMAEFTAALLEDQQAFGVFCSGGDTTGIQGGVLSISITVIGLVPNDKAVKRSGAQDGDALILSGPLGDAFIGLQILRRDLHSDDDAYFTRAYFRPQPRFDLVPAMRVHAHAAIDISDGLIADLGHICAASNLGATIHLDHIRYSEAAQKLIEKGGFDYKNLLSAGDDYELLLAVPENAVAEIMKHHPSAMQIGTFSSRHKGVVMIDSQGHSVPFEDSGWSHF